MYNLACAAEAGADGSVEELRDFRLTWNGGAAAAARWEVPGAAVAAAPGTLTPGGVG
jgi:hypothetical protein